MHTCTRCRKKVEAVEQSLGKPYCPPCAEKESSRRQELADLRGNGRFIELDPTEKIVNRHGGKIWL